MVLDYNPILRDIQKVIKKHFYLLQPSPEVKEIFPSKSIFAAYRRTKILKEMLAPSKFRLTSSRNQIEEHRGCSKCDMKCDLCKNYLIQASKFQSSATGRQYPIQQGLSCSSLQYVGSTSTEFRVTFRNHKSNMLKNKRTCELAIHFHDSEYEITQINFIIIENLGLWKIPYILNDYYSLGKPIGPRNYSPLILMVSTNGENLDQNTALITTIE